MAFSLSNEMEKVVDELVARYPTKMAACIPVLHLCQEEEGWVSPDIVDYVAGRLDMSTGQVKGVVTFYTSYHQEKVGENVVWVCRTLSCELRGAKTIQEHLEKRLGCGVGGTSKDGKVTLKKAECLAACGKGPMIQLNDQYFEDLDAGKLDAILDDVGVAPMPGPKPEIAKPVVAAVEPKTAPSSAVAKPAVAKPAVAKPAVAKPAGVPMPQMPKPKAIAEPVLPKPGAKEEEE